MNKILSTQADQDDWIVEVEEAAGQYPAVLQDKVREAFQAAEDQDYGKVIRLCGELLDYDAKPQIRELLGISYFMSGRMQDARQVFMDLTAEDPREAAYSIYLGMTEHALGRYQEAVKVLGKWYPLEVYRPFYYTAYGDSLQQTGRLKESREAFRRDAAFFEETGNIVSDMMLDGTFQNLLYLDVTLGNGKYPEDLKLYYDFLEKAEMTEELQHALAGNIVYFCGLMSNKWYRPLFLEFITHVKESGFLTSEEPLKTLKSAFSSWESYAYREDRRICSLMETFLNTQHNKCYMSDLAYFEEEKDRQKMEALVYEWYLCQYAPEHWEEIEYIRETYPRTYADNAAFFEKVKKDKAGTEKTIEEELLACTEGRESLEKIHESMLRAYEKALKTEKEPTYVYDGGDTYRRMQPKVGRNDPCPCGSGKKYKKCCGR